MSESQFTCPFAPEHPASARNCFRKDSFSTSPCPMHKHSCMDFWISGDGEEKSWNFSISGTQIPKTIVRDLPQSIGTNIVSQTPRFSRFADFYHPGVSPPPGCNLA
eukprot:3210766-Rhodomonas_salina.1